MPSLLLRAALVSSFALFFALPAAALEPQPGFVVVDVPFTYRPIETQGDPMCNVFYVLEYPDVENATVYEAVWFETATGRRFEKFAPPFNDTVVINSSQTGIVEHNAPPGFHWASLPGGAWAQDCGAAADVANVWSDFSLQALVGDDDSIALEFSAETREDNKTAENDIVPFTLTATPSSEVTSMTIVNTLPPRTRLVAGSVTGGGVVNGDTITWTFGPTEGETMGFTLEIRRQPRDTLFITNRANVAANFGPGRDANGELNFSLDYLSSYVIVELADADPDAMGGLFLPDAGNAETLPSLDFSRNRFVNGVAADGVALLLVRATFRAQRHGKLVLTLDETEFGAEPGELATTEDTSLIDDSAAGGMRDGEAAGATTLELEPVRNPFNRRERVAFALYRAPRNFDQGAATAALKERPVALRADLYDRDDDEIIETKEIEINVVRPLVVLQHGTFDEPDGWLGSPLWYEGARDESNYVGGTPDFPFLVGRSDFSMYRKGAGDLAGSAPWAQRTLVREIDQWKEATGYAGAQADVVCHSYGGVNMRRVTELQLYNDPIVAERARNFRNATNWGHGSIHKLITIATTHRGSPLGNHIAFLNHFGAEPGIVRYLAESEGSAVDAGATGDQMILSPVLRDLGETRVPGHAIAGSGLVEFNFSYEERLMNLWLGDYPFGPFRTAGGIYDAFVITTEGVRGIGANYDVFRRVSNYGFNLVYDPPLSDDLTQDPNYDLTVSSYSSKGRMPYPQHSTPRDVEAAVGAKPGSMTGYMTHGDQIFPGAARVKDIEPDTVYAVGARVAMLLREHTDSEFFGFFPATLAAPPTFTENEFSDPSRFDPEWLHQRTDLENVLGLTARGDEAWISVEPPVTTVAPGDSLVVTLNWPGHEIDDGWLAMPGRRPEEPKTTPLIPGATQFTYIVPERRRGPFMMRALMKAGEEKAIAQLDFELVDTSYDFVFFEDPARTLRSDEPAVPVLNGWRAEGGIFDLRDSSLLSLVSSDDSVVAIDDEGFYEPRGFGTATITATYDGTLTDTQEVTVSGVSVPVAVAPKKKGKVKSKKKKPADFVFLSGPTFDIAKIDRDSIRVAGETPVKFKEKDYNKDGVKDLAAFVSPQLLGLQPGRVEIPMYARTMDGALVSGLATATVK